MSLTPEQKPLLMAGSEGPGYTQAVDAPLERDDFRGKSSRSILLLRMIFSENRDHFSGSCGWNSTCRYNPLRQKLNSHLVSELTKAEEELRVG
jgi:hypothetical protein